MSRPFKVGEKVMFRPEAQQLCSGFYAILKEKPFLYEEIFTIERTGRGSSKTLVDLKIVKAPYKDSINNFFHSISTDRLMRVQENPNEEFE